MAGVKRDVALLFVVGKTRERESKAIVHGAMIPCRLLVRIPYADKNTQEKIGGELRETKSLRISAILRSVRIASSSPQKE